MKKKKAFYRSLPVHIAREAANLNIIAINELLEFYEPYLQKCAMNLLWDNETNMRSIPSFSKFHIICFEICKMIGSHCCL